MVITIAANIAETAILTYPACFPDSVVGFIANESMCDVQFIEYQFRILRSKLQHENVGTGSVQDNINLRILDELRFPLPPLPQQRAIAHILGTLDDKIELNRRMNETLEEMARALFKSWFVDFDPVRAKMEGRWRPGESLLGLPAEHYDLFLDRLVPSELGEIPEGWEVKTLGDVCSLRAGSAFPRDAQGKTVGSYPFAKVSDMNLPNNSVFILGAANWVDDADLINLKARPFPEGTTIFAKIGEALKYNRLRLLVQPTLADNNLMGAIPVVDRVDPVILFCSLANFDFGEVAGGTALPYLAASTVSNLPILLPPLDVQKALSQILGQALTRIRSNDSESIILSQLRDALLPKLVSGEMRVGSLSNRGARQE